MGSPTSVTTENPEQPRQQGRAGPRGTPTAATDVVDATYSDEHPSSGPWLGEPAPPTGVLNGGAGRVDLLLRGVLPLPSFGAAAGELEYLRTETPPHLRRPPSS